EETFEKGGAAAWGFWRETTLKGSPARGHPRRWVCVSRRVCVRASAAPAGADGRRSKRKRTCSLPSSCKRTLLAGDEYDRCRRVFEHGRGGVAEEQLVARAPAHPHHDQVMAACLHFGENRLVWGHVGVHGGSRQHVVAVRHFDDIPPDRLPPPAPPKAATLAPVACAARGNVERRDRAVAGARDCDRDVGGSPRYLVSGHRHEEMQRTLLRLLEMIAVCGHDGERPLEG